MKRIFAFLLVFNQACMPGDQHKYLDNLKPTTPTKKEIAYVNELKKKGVKEVYLDIPIPGYGAKATAEYRLEIYLDFDPLPDNSQLKDTLDKIGYSISNELYSNIVEDSILVDCRKFHIEFFINSIPAKKARPGSIPYEIDIKELEKINGFRVEKTGEKKFE